MRAPERQICKLNYVTHLVTRELYFLQYSAINPLFLNLKLPVSWLVAGPEIGQDKYYTLSIS